MTNSQKDLYRTLGIIFLILAAFLLGLSLFLTGQQGWQLSWLFYGLIGLLYLKPSWLVKAYKTKPYVGGLLLTPALLGLLVVILGDLGKLPVAIELDIFPIILYCTAFATTMEKEKKENRHEKEQ